MNTVDYQKWLESILASLKKHTHVYMIEMRKNDSKWFFLDLEHKKEPIVQILWTPNKKNARIFLTEQTVEEFKADYLSPRKVSIIRMTTYEAFRPFN